MIRILLCIAVMLAAPAAMASEATFKTVKVPPKGATNRINIQIVPPTPVAVAPDVSALEVGVLPSEHPGNLHNWFWDEVSPALAPPDRGRFGAAVERAGAAPLESGIAAPSLEVLHKIAINHGTDILMNSVGTRVSPALALAVIAVESAGRAEAVSSAGAEGLMQLIPATAERFGVADSKNPAQNIAGGVAYLDWLMSEFYDDPLLALAGYNAGENAVKKHGGVPPYAETRAYVPKVLAAWNVARLLCATPPELPSDGCVFKIPRPIN